MNKPTLNPEVRIPHHLKDKDLLELQRQKRLYITHKRIGHDTTPFYAVRQKNPAKNTFPLFEPQGD